MMAPGGASHALRVARSEDTMYVALIASALLLGLMWMEPPLAEAGDRTPRVVFVRYPTQPSPPPPTPEMDAFRQALAGLGWTAGKNLRLDERSTERNGIETLARKIIAEGVDVFVTNATSVTVDVRKATTTIPIVVATSADPVGTVVEQLARPGGNVTGLSMMASDLAGKQLQLAKELVPGLRRVALIHPPGGGFPTIARWLGESERAADSLGLTTQRIGMDGADRWDERFGALRREGVDAVALGASPRYRAHAATIATAALKHRMPTIMFSHQLVDAGGLFSYAADTVEMHRRAAVLVDKILRGAKPGDLPVEAPMRFDLVVNLKTARALGLTVPPSMLLQATRVVE